MELFPYLLLAGLILICSTALAVADKPKRSSPDLEEMADHLEKLTEYGHDTYQLLEQIYETQAAIRGALDRIDAREAGRDERDQMARQAVLTDILNEEI